MNGMALRGGIVWLALLGACGSSATPRNGGGGEQGGEGGDGGAGEGGGGGSGGSGGKMMPPKGSPDASADEGTAPPEPDAGTLPSDTAPPADTAPDVQPPTGEFPLAAVKAAKAVAFASVKTQTEGPSFRVHDASVYFASDSNGLVRADAMGKLWKYHPTLNPVGTYLLADESILVCEKAWTVVQVFKDGSVGSLFSAADHQKVDFCNDLTIDAKGDVYFSNPHKNEVWRMSVAGTLDKVMSGMEFPNGLEVDPESKNLYVAVGGALQRIALPESGNVFPAPEKVGPAGADGMAFDAWGHLWLSIYSMGKLSVWDPATKQVIASVPAGGAGSTNVCFADGMLFTTVADVGLFKVTIPGIRGFLHPGAAKYTIKQMLDAKPVNTAL
jgi:sugar lactone lactonase YvrE